MTGADVHPHPHEVGDGHKRWFRGMPKPERHFTALRSDFYIYVVGPLMRYVHADLEFKQFEIMKTFKHGFDGVSFIEADPHKEVYAIAEKCLNPRIYICKVEKKKDTWGQRIMAKLSGIQATEIRAIRFNKKEIVLVLTGYPTFSLSIWKWTTEQELMLNLTNEPSEFSDILISPVNDNVWIEYGRQHLTFYDLQSFTKNDVQRVEINLPMRQFTMDQPDPGMGSLYAMSVVSACFTNTGEFYVLDNQLGLHILNNEEKSLIWICSIGYGFLGTSIYRIVPFGDSIAEVHTDGWILAYGNTETGTLKVRKSYKMSSKIKKYIQFPGSPESFLAITEKEGGLVEGVENGELVEPLCITDFLFSNVRQVVFIEPIAEQCAVLAENGKITILDSETGDLIEKWKLPFKVACILCHPILPFFFCGTTYGCVNVLDIQNLKKPKLISKVYLTDDSHSALTVMNVTCEGKYVLAADTPNDKLFLMYGFPFEEFEFCDYVKLPGEIRTIHTPLFNEKDNRVQVFVYAKHGVEEICPTYIYNYSVENSKFTLISAQALDHPIKAMCFAPFDHFMFSYFMDKKQIGLTPFPKSSHQVLLPKTENFIGDQFDLDVNKIVAIKDRIYTFGEDGHICLFHWVTKKPSILKSLHPGPEMEDPLAFIKELRKTIEAGKNSSQSDLRASLKKRRSTKEPEVVAVEDVVPSVESVPLMTSPSTIEELEKAVVDMAHLEQVFNIQTHCPMDRGIAEGCVSFNGAHAATIGFDGTLTVLKLTDKPRDANLFHFGFIRPEIFNYQMSCYQRDQDRQRVGKKLRNRIELIRVQEEEEVKQLDEELTGMLLKTQQSEHKEVELAKGKPSSRMRQDLTESSLDTLDSPDFKKKQKRHRSLVRRQLEQDAERLRREGRSERKTDYGEESFQEIDFTAPAPTAAPSNASTKAAKSARSRKKRRLLGEPGTPKKYKNVKSKVAEQIKEQEERLKFQRHQQLLEGTGGDDDMLIDAGSEEPEQPRPHHQEIEDEEEDDIFGRGTMIVEQTLPQPKPQLPSISVPGTGEDLKPSWEQEGAVGAKGEEELEISDDSSSTSSGASAATTSTGFDKFKKLKLKRKTKDYEFDPNDDGIQERYRKGSAFFDEVESEAGLVLPRQGTVGFGDLKMSEGIDVDGTVCVGFDVGTNELTAFENLERFEFTLTARQHGQKAVKLMQVFEKLMELFAVILQRNFAREPELQFPLEDFIIDDEYYASLKKKMVDYPKYCEIQMQARNKLRRDRIDRLRKTIWDSCIRKGKSFLAFTTPIIVSNYPLKSLTDTFGHMIQQCHEERRLEERIEAVETEMTELGSSYLLTIIRAEMKYVSPESRESYMRSIMLSTDLGAPMKSLVDEETAEDKKMSLAAQEEETLKAVLQELGMTNMSYEKMKEDVEKKGKHSHGSNKKPTLAFGAHMSSKKSALLRRQKGNIRKKTEDKGKRRKVPKQKPISTAKQRMLARQRKVEAEKKSVLPGEEHHRKSSEKADKLKQKLVHIGYTMNDLSGLSIDSELSESEYESDSDFSMARDMGPVKKDFLEAIRKHHKDYMFARGIFGPKGARRRRQSKVDTLLESVKDKPKRKKKDAGKEDEHKTKKRKSKKFRGMDRDRKAAEEFFIPSEDEGVDGEDGEDWEAIAEEDQFHDMKMTKYSRIEDDDQIAAFFNVYRAFSGNLRHELEEVYQYRPSPYQYHQLELRARQELVRQVWLLMEEIYRLRLFFDDLFEEAAKYKAEVLERVRVRNARIRDIFFYLNLELDVIDDEIGITEDPSPIFEVKEGEIPVEKFQTEAQIRRQKEAEEEVLRRILEEEMMEAEDDEEYDFEEEEEDDEEEEEMSNENEEEARKPSTDAEQRFMDTQIKALEARMTMSRMAIEESLTGFRKTTQKSGSQVGGFLQEEDELEGRESKEGLEEDEDEEEEEEEDGEEEEEQEDGESEMPAFLKALLSEGEKREDLLFKEIEAPAFMATKNMMEFSLDEFIAVRQYRKDCEELEAEKAKMMGNLQHELHQHYRANAADFNSIDLRLKELFQTKMYFQYNIYCEECNIMRLIRLMRMVDDCTVEEERINAKLEKQQNEMKAIQMLVSQLGLRKNECKEKETIIVERQNELEKKFRKDLGDVGHYLGYFLKNYKRKPKIQARGFDKAEVYEVGVHALKASNLRAFGRDHGDPARQVVMAIMDLEDPMLMPSGCPRTFWEKFCKLRRKRLVCDFEVKFVNLEMENIVKGLQECGEKEENVAKGMAATLSTLSHRMEIKNYLLYNMEFQFIIGKGSVEINFWDLNEHENAVMTVSNNIEDLNTRVSAATERYIRDTKRCIFIHRDVRDLEWKFRAIRRTKQDLDQLLKDISQAKPTRELLNALNEGIDLTVVREERVQKVKDLIQHSIQHHKQYIKKMKKLKSSVLRQIEKMKKTNEALAEWLDKENKNTSQMKHEIITTTPEQRVEKLNARIQRFLSMGYMVRKVHENYRTIKFLEAQIANCYQKSFPYL